MVSKRSKQSTTCESCETPFFPWQNGRVQRYCSAACRAEAQRRPLAMTCERCGEGFTVYQARADARFCSWECRAAGVVKDCAVCGLPFRIKPSDAQERETCSRSCGTKLQAQRRKAPMQGKTQSSETRKRVTDGLRRFYAGNPEKHWNYQGGAFVQPRGPSWPEQRQSARDRDGHTCRVCGITEETLGKALSVHHLTPFRRFPSSQEANVLTNLVSVCQSCHMKLEHGKVQIHSSNTPISNI